MKAIFSNHPLAVWWILWAWPGFFSRSPEWPSQGEEQRRCAMSSITDSLLDYSAVCGEHIHGMMMRMAPMSKTKITSCLSKLKAFVWAKKGSIDVNECCHHTHKSVPGGRRSDTEMLLLWESLSCQHGTWNVLKQTKIVPSWWQNTERVATKTNVTAHSEFILTATGFGNFKLHWPPA